MPLIIGALIGGARKLFGGGGKKKKEQRGTPYKDRAMEAAIPQTQARRQRRPTPPSVQRAAGRRNGRSPRSYSR